MANFFFDFPEQVENDFKADVPSTLYKYRVWNEKFHRESLTHLSIWFSNPKTLNDIWDIRLPYKFNLHEIYHPIFFEKLKKYHPDKTPEDLKKLYEQITEDPNDWIIKNIKGLRDGETYDQIGVFSTSKSPLIDTMWVYYCKEHTGFCIGYDSYKLLSARPCSAGHVDYDKGQINYSFLVEQDYNFAQYFIKDGRWSHEDEFRFVTFVDNENDRSTMVDRSAIKEIIFGKNISSDDRREILCHLKSDFDSSVHVYDIDEDLLEGKLAMKKIEQ